MALLAPISTTYAICTDSLSSKDDIYASSNAALVLCWDHEGRYVNALIVASISNDLSW